MMNFDDLKGAITKFNIGSIPNNTSTFFSHCNHTPNKCNIYIKLRITDRFGFIGLFGINILAIFILLNVISWLKCLQTGLYQIAA